MRTRSWFLLAWLLCATIAWAANKTPMTDDMINDRVKLKLAQDTTVKGGGLSIDVKQGVVTLSGKVESEKQKQKAERLARKIDGVKSVTNQITVAQH